MCRIFRHFACGFIFLVACMLCGCSGVQFSEWHFPYMMQVQQGNYITQAQFKQLKIGQTKEQVAFIMGSPLTQFMFNQNRWDFMYQNYKNNDLKNSYTVTLMFDKQEKLTKIIKIGDVFDK